jgi:hypothetical protein
MVQKMSYIKKLLDLHKFNEYIIIKMRELEFFHGTQVIKCCVQVFLSPNSLIKFHLILRKYNLTVYHEVAFQLLLGIAMENSLIIYKALIENKRQISNFRQ